MKKVSLAIAASLMLISSTSSAHNRTLAQSFIETLPDAVADGTLIDTPIALVLWGLGIAPAVSIPLTAVTATGGYSIRKTCNDYLNQEQDWKIASFCGFAGGSVKYSSNSASKGEFTKVEPLLGAADGGTYEATSGVRGNYMTAEYMAIEGGVAALCYALRPPGATPTTLWAEVKMGLTIGAFVSAAVQTTYELYAPSVKGLVKTGIDSAELIATSFKNSVTGAIERFQKTYIQSAQGDPEEKKEL